MSLNLVMAMAERRKNEREAAMQKRIALTYSNVYFMVPIRIVKKSAPRIMPRRSFTGNWLSLSQPAERD